MENIDDKRINRDIKRYYDKKYGKTSKKSNLNKECGNDEECRYCRPDLFKRLNWETYITLLLKYSDKYDDYNPKL